MSENELKIVFSADTEDIGTASERIDTLGGKLSQQACSQSRRVVKSKRLYGFFFSGCGQP